MGQAACRHLPHTSRSPLHLPVSPSHPLVTPFTFLQAHSALRQMRQRQLQKAVDAGQCSVGPPSRPFQGEHQGPPALRFLTARCPHTRLLTSTPGAWPPDGHLGTPLPSLSCPWNTHCSGLHTPVLVDYPTGPPQTLSTQDQAPGGGNGGVQLQDRGCLLPGYLGQRLAGEGVVAAEARRPWSPGSRRTTPAGRQPSTLRSAGHPRRPQARLHTGVPATAAALQPHGAAESPQHRSLGERGSQTPTGSLQAPSGGKAAKSLTSWMDTTSGTPPCPGQATSQEPQRHNRSRSDWASLVTRLPNG